MTLRITLRVPPGDLAVNARTVPRKSDGRLIKSSKYRLGLDQATLQVRQEVVRAKWKTTPHTVAVRIVTHWRTQMGDVDATVKAVLDALEAGGVVANDRQCHPVKLDAVWSDPDPRIEVEVSHG